VKGIPCEGFILEGHMGKSIIITVVVLLPLAICLSGCEVLEAIKRDMHRPASESKRPILPDKKKGYLARKSRSAFKDRPDTFPNVGPERKISDPSPVKNYSDDASEQDFQNHLASEKALKDKALIELSTLRGEFGKRIFELQNKLEKANKEIQQYKESALDAELKTLRLKQEMDHIQLNLLTQKSLFNANYPVYYEVRQGDNLWKIASQNLIYNDPYKWMEIFYANQDKVGDPDLIFPGMVLKIPRYFEMMLSSFPDNQNSGASLLLSGESSSRGGHQHPTDISGMGLPGKSKGGAADDRDEDYF